VTKSSEPQNVRYHKAFKGLLIVIKSRTVRKVWKISDRHFEKTPGLIAGISYGDRSFIFLITVVQAVGWIVFFSGADFAENLAKRLLDVNQMPILDDLFPSLVTLRVSL